MSWQAGSPSGLLGYVQALEGKNSRARGEQILAALATMGLKPVMQECRWPRIRNIIVDFPPRHSAAQLLFTAHYDVVKGSPGANDNASGVAVLLGLCNELQRSAEPPRVVFFDREEAWLRMPGIRLGVLGSTYYVWRTGLPALAAVYNIEFCGQGDSLGIWPVKGREISLPAVRQAQAAASSLHLPAKTIHIPWPLLSSDHLSFRLRGFRNAVTLSLVPSNQLAALERFLGSLRLFALVAGQRPRLPEPLDRIHRSDDTSSRISEGSLSLMLSILLEVIRGSKASPQEAAPSTA